MSFTIIIYASILVGVFLLASVLLWFVFFICFLCLVVLFIAWLHGVISLAAAGAQQSSGAGDEVPPPKPAPRKSQQPAQGNQTTAQVTDCCSIPSSCCTLCWHLFCSFCMSVLVVLSHAVNCWAAAGSGQSGDRVPPPRPPPPGTQPTAQGWFSLWPNHCQFCCMYVIVIAFFYHWFRVTFISSVSIRQRTRLVSKVILMTKAVIDKWW